MNDDLHNRAQEIWQCQAVEGLHLSADEIRRRAGKFQSRIHWRNLGEYAGGLVATLLFGSFLLKSHDILFRTAFGFFIAGLAYVAFQLQRKGSARSMPAAMGSATCLQFYRRELERQRDLVASVWRWYLGPLVPGFAMYSLAYALAFPHPDKLAGLALLDGMAAALFFLIWRLNVRAARSLQRLIDDLSSAEKRAARWSESSRSSITKLNSPKEGRTP
jgi:hypothetical protein